MKPYQAIDCGRYDYLELACIRGYPLKIELLQGEILHGKALITETRPDKSEWLLVQTATSNRAFEWINCWLSHLSRKAPSLAEC